MKTRKTSNETLRFEVVGQQVGNGHQWFSPVNFGPLSALVERTGAIVRCCLPGFDPEPVFSTLLDAGHGGEFVVGPADGSAGTQRYLDDTDVLETTSRTSDGVVRLIDFAPRFNRYDRTFQPTQAMRIVEPVDVEPGAH